MVDLNISRGLGCTLAVACYYMLATIIFTCTRDDWNNDLTNIGVDAFYFATVTLTTIGFGDITPNNDLTKLLICFLLLYGLTLIAYAIEVLAEILLARQKAFQDSFLLATSEELQEFSDLNNALFGPRVRKIFKGVILLVSQIGISAVVFYSEENSTFLDALYFSVVSCTTVGYGDFYPTTTVSRAVFSIWLIIATLTTGFALELITSGVLNLDGKLVSERLQRMKQKLPMYIFDKIDRVTGVPKSEGVLDELEFVIAKLYQISAIDDTVVNLIRPLRKRFSDVDKDGTGFITKSEVENFFMPTAFVSKSAKLQNPEMNQILPS